MDIREFREGDVLILAPDGAIAGIEETSAIETRLNASLKAGFRMVVLDCANVGQLGKNLAVLVELAAPGAEHHTINDAQKWEQGKQRVMSKVQAGTLPAGLKPLLIIPGTNQKNTFCLWEADSIDTLRKFIDGESGAAARNEYFQVDTKNAVGLPEAAAV